MAFVLADYSTKEVGRPSTAKVLPCTRVTTAHSSSCAASVSKPRVRPSLAFYNTFEEIDRLIAVVRRLASVRRTG